MFIIMLNLQKSEENSWIQNSQFIMSFPGKVWFFPTFVFWSWICSSKNLQNSCFSIPICIGYFRIWWHIYRGPCVDVKFFSVNSNPSTSTQNVQILLCGVSMNGYFSFSIQLKQPNKSVITLDKFCCSRFSFCYSLKVF